MHADINVKLTNNKSKMKNTHVYESCHKIMKPSFVDVSINKNFRAFNQFWFLAFDYSVLS
jgi:hypothetical protein